MNALNAINKQEPVSPHNAVLLLVDQQEGLFAKEGLEIEWVERESEDKSTQVNVNTPKGLNPFSSHGKMLEQGKADMYNACEWGNYCRVQETQVGSRQVGRRGIVSYAAIVVRPDSSVRSCSGSAPAIPCFRRRSCSATARRARRSTTSIPTSPSHIQA